MMSGKETILEPFSAFDCTNSEKNATRKLPEPEHLTQIESDESLGILPDLLSDELTFDFFKIGLCSNDIQESHNPELDINPASMVPSPLVDKQFKGNMENISTPLSNFGNNRKYSSTPKILAASLSEYSIESNSLNIFSDDKEPIIAGSCHIKFDTDFNLDDLKNPNALTSTKKALSSQFLSSIFKELNEETNLKYELNVHERPETVENNLNVTQTFSDNQKLFPYKCEENMNILKSFQIEQPVLMESCNPTGCLENPIPINRKICEVRSNKDNQKGKVVDLESTFVVPEDQVSDRRDREETFLVDLNSTIGPEIISMFTQKDEALSKIHILETETDSKQQDSVVNTTFTKETGDNAQISENHCGSFTVESKLLAPILEETFEIDLNERGNKNVDLCSGSKSQPALSETFNIQNFTVLKKIEILSEMNLCENDCSQIKVTPLKCPKASGNGDQVRGIIFHEPNAINETNFCIQTPLSAEVQSTVSPKDCSFKILLKSSNPNIDILEYAKKTVLDGNLISLPKNDQASRNGPKKMLNVTFSEETGEVGSEQSYIEKNKDQTFMKETSDIHFSKLADSQLQQGMHLSQLNGDSVDKKTSLGPTSFDLKGTNTNSSLETKTFKESILLKPSKSGSPRRVSEHWNGRLSKTSTRENPNDRKSIISKYNRRVSLSLSSADDIKPKNDFNRPSGIASKIGIKVLETNFQKPRIDKKFSNEYLENRLKHEKDLIFQPTSISNNKSKIGKSAAVSLVNQPVSSRLSLNGQSPKKSHKIKAWGLNTDLSFTDEKSSNKISCCPKIIDPLRKRTSEIISIADARTIYSRHSIATHLPTKIPPPFNKICPPKTSVIKQKSASASNSCKSDSVKALSAVKLDKSIPKPKISSLPKVQACAKISYENGSQNEVGKRFASRNQKSEYVSKSCKLGCDQLQNVKSQISTIQVNMQTNTREGAVPKTLRFSSSGQALQSLKPINVKQSKGKCNFLPVPPIANGGSVRNMNSKVCQPISENFRLRRIPVPSVKR